MKKEYSKLLRALNLDKSGDWDGAHRIVQAIESKEASLVHAYLHRKEGDLSNARYWYNRAGANEFIGKLEDEWIDLFNLINM